VNWILLAIAAGLLFVGIDMLRLAKTSSPLSQREMDEFLVGKNQPPPSQTARNFAGFHVARSRAPIVRLLGLLLILASLALGAVSVGWL